MSGCPLLARSRTFLKASEISAFGNEADIPRTAINGPLVIQHDAVSTGQLVSFYAMQKNTVGVQLTADIRPWPTWWPFVGI